MFWHGMSQDIISMIENSETCQRTQRAPPTEPMIPKEIPKLPWEILASDIFIFEGTDYLFITDNYSSYIGFKTLKESTSKSIIEIIKDWFSVHGIPRILETDNCKNYASWEFETFSKQWMSHHQTSSLLYPKVWTAKNLLKKCKLSSRRLHGSFELPKHTQR